MAGLTFSRPSEDTLLVHLAGSWTLRDTLPAPGDVERQLEASPSPRRIAFEVGELETWDSGLITFLIRLLRACEGGAIEPDPAGLPEGAQRLLSLALAVPRQEVGREEIRGRFLARVGAETTDLVAGGREFLTFVGEVARALFRFLQGRARYRRKDLWLILQDCSARAVPVVTLISFLVGLILAFVGAVQLRQFGAQIFVADLVGLGMALDMGAMMTGIIMAGRTGAAFAAQLGTMTVNEEIDALRTMGISPIEFLVTPRVLALVLMMPLLCLYADFLGILGGLVVGVGMLDLGMVEYLDETRAALVPKHFIMGLIKGTVYGAMVALAGCLRGMQCGRSASAVGGATTSAVVTAIVLIILSSATLTVIYDVLGL